MERGLEGSRTQSGGESRGTKMLPLGGEQGGMAQGSEGLWLSCKARRCLQGPSRAEVLRPSGRKSPTLPKRTAGSRDEDCNYGCQEGFRPLRAPSTRKGAQQGVGAWPLLEVNSIYLGLHVQRREMKNYLSKQNNRLDIAETSSQAENRSQQSGLTETKQKKVKE